MRWDTLSEHMGNFSKAVRTGKLMSPFRLGFDFNVWIERSRAMGSGDQTDLDLVLLGLALHVKLTRFWQRFGELRLDRLPGEKLRRAFVAMVNRDFATLGGKIEETIKAFSKKERLFLEELHSAKVSGALSGGEYSVDDLAASGVDGLLLPLRKTFESAPDASHELELSAPHGAVLLGQVHSLMLGIWEDCLWSHHRLWSNDGKFCLIPADLDRARARAVGYARLLALHSQMNQWGIHLWKRMTDAQRRAITTNRYDVKLSGSGEKLRIRLTPAALNPKFPSLSFALRLVASELYFRELFEMELPKLPGVTPAQLLSAWEILFGIAGAIAKRLPTASAIKQVQDLWQFAPVLPVRVLIQAIAEGLGISVELSRSIINFLTFSAEQQDELWVRPFVKLDEENVTPVLTCLRAPNPLRMVEKWMKYGKLELQSKGGAFERHAREQLIVGMRSSRLLRNGGVCPHAYALPLRGDDNPGDIDLIIWFGDTVLLGEVKCNLFPAHASEFHNYFGVLEKAGAQILRKAQAFQLDSDRFWREIAKRQPPAHTQVVPLILSNLPLGAGLKFYGVPVTDLLILQRFLDEGLLRRFVKFEPNAEPRGETETHFYRSPEEAEKVIASYLARPPQLEHFEAGVVPVRNLLPPLDEKDEAWPIVDYEVQLDGVDIEARRANLHLPSNLLESKRNHPRPLEGPIQFQ